MKRFHVLQNPALIGLVLLLLLSGLATAQDRYAVDAAAGCYGEVPSDPSLIPGPEWTSECWVYQVDDEDEVQWILASGLGSESYNLVVENGFSVATIINNGGLFQSLWADYPLALGAWSHIGICFDGSEFALYLNGTLNCTVTPIVSSPQTSGPIYFSEVANLQFDGLIDQTRSSSMVRYADDFDPFTAFLPDLRVGDQEITGWELGTGPGDFSEAWDATSLYMLINGAAPPYLENNFQYAVRQYYYGQIGGVDVTLNLWMTDQGTPEDAEALFHEPAIMPFFYEEIDSIGDEARLDTFLLWDWVIDFHRDQYYVKITCNKENEPDEALQVTADFAVAEDNHIIDRDLFTIDENTVACWHFDEGSGSDFLDASGNGHDGSLTDPAWVATQAYRELVYITSSVIYDGVNLEAEIDPDDTARVTFSDPLIPVEINASNIDEILPLSSGHSWLSGSGEIGSASWNGTNDTLTVTFNFNGDLPTIAYDDTLSPNPAYIQSADTIQAGGYRFIRSDVPLAVNPSPEVQLPTEITLKTPYPTPFNAQTRIELLLPQREFGSLKVYDTQGRVVGTLFKGYFKAGSSYHTWDAVHAASGVYIVVFESTSTVKTKKTVLIK
ncbi:T9SS type A sorting domain-containing protein [bacterium]|nr:T9SS type A sorting domain-containing protein [bacterium]MBU1652566.1 T9SS type A sorting domain-containing protein [bacterium]MBU1881473.1 T9SS type A sorting domain-containing protein [bacterium]